MEVHSRGFKGIWITREIWLNKELSFLEKCIYAEIDSLSKTGDESCVSEMIEPCGCYASNEYFASFFNVSERWIRKSISNLKSKGLVVQESFDGRRRILMSLPVREELQFRSEVNKSSGLLPILDKKVYKEEVTHSKRPKEDNPNNQKYTPLSNLLLEKIKTSGTDAVFNETHLKNWNNCFRLMVEQDHRTEEQIRAKINVVFEDGFWLKNIRSAGTLREKWNQGKLDRLSSPEKKPAERKYCGAPPDYGKQD